MNRRSFLSGIRNFAIGLAISPKLDLFLPESLAPAETRIPPSITESVTPDQLNLITRKELWPALINDYWFTDSPLFARLKYTGELSFKSGSKLVRGYSVQPAY